VNQRCVGVLRNGQDDAIARLLRSSVVVAIVMIVVVMRGAGVLVGCGVSALMLGGAGKLLEEMMYPMWRRRDQEKAENRGGSESEAAPELRERASGVHRVSTLS
jgi:hypothetical protein